MKPAAALATSNPFKGLQPYGPGDPLFGRDADLTVMKDRVFRARTTLLFAGSGVGKTSFFRAKFIPEMQRRYREQFAVRYHNEWGGRDPLETLKSTLGADAGQPLLTHLRRPPSPTGVWLLVLDQFEELFQYHTYWSHFGRFRDELSEVINAAEAPVRVIFTMREEFLGQLSAFDNRIPDLFANYYRLKNPDKVQASEIIRLTAAAVGHEVDDLGLETLVEDLSLVEAPGGRLRRALVARDYVIPPHLQLVCQGLWSKQARGQADHFRFLEGYEKAPRRGRKNPARRILQEFCVDRVKALDAEQQAIAARSFDYLVTSQGAKMAYELKSLAKHMGVDEKRIGATLGKLSEDARILRESRWQEERWFELYHDMYAPIMYEWKEAFERKQRRERLNEEQASVCDRRAVQAEARENRDEALMLWLKAIETRDTELRRRQAARLARSAAGLARTFRHDGPILATAFGGDGRYVAVASAVTAVAGETAAPEAGAPVKAAEPGSLVQVWSVETGAPVGRPVVMDGSVNALALSADGSTTAAYDGERLRVVDVRATPMVESIPLATPERFRRPNLSFNPAGDTMLLHYSSGFGALYTVVHRSGAKRAGSRKGYLRLFVDPGGRLVAGLRGQWVEILDATTMEPAGPPITIGGRPLGVAFSSDGARLLVGTRAGTAGVWDTTTGERVGEQLVHPGPVRRVAFAQVAQREVVRTLSTDAPNALEGVHLLQQWDVRGERIGESLAIPLRKSENPQFSAGGRFLHLAVGAAAWDAERGHAIDPTWATEPRVRTVWAANDAYVLAYSNLGTARLWDPSAAPTAPTPLRHVSGVQSASLSADGMRVALHARDGSVSMWTADGRLVRRIPHEKPVESMALGPNGRVAMIGGGLIRVCSARGSEIGRLRLQGTGELRFDPGGRAIFVIVPDAAVRHWAFATGARRARMLRAGGELVQSRGGRLFVTYTSPEGAITIWDGTKVRKVGACRHEGGAAVVVLSADSRLLLSGGEDGRAVVRSTPDGQTLHVWLHQGAVEAAAFSASGRYAATLSADQFVRVWEVTSGREVGRFRYQGYVQALDFSPDDSSLMFASKWWIHSYAVAGGVAPLASRRLGGAWTGEYRFLDARGARVLVLVRPGPNGFRCDTIDFRAVDDAPLAGTAAALQEEWSGRTGLSYEGEEVVPTALAKGSRPRAARRRPAEADAQTMEVGEPL